MKRNDTKTASNACINTTGVIVSTLSAQAAHRTSKNEVDQFNKQNCIIDGMTVSLSTCLCCAMQPGSACLVCATGNLLKRANAVRTHLNYENRPTSMAEAYQPAYSVSGVVNAAACCWSLCSAPTAASALCINSTRHVPYLLPMGVNAASMAANFYPASSTAIPEARIFRLAHEKH